MIEKYNNLLAEVAFLEDDSLKYNFYFSMLRSMLQIASITAFDVAWYVADDNEKVELSALSKTLLQPSDGDFVCSLDICIQILRLSGWRNCVPNWFDNANRSQGELPLRVVCPRLD